MKKSIEPKIEGVGLQTYGSFGMKVNVSGRLGIIWLAVRLMKS